MAKAPEARDDARAIEVAVPLSLSLRLRCRPAALRELRQAIDTLDHLPPATLDALKLVATELASNSIRHSGLGDDDHFDVLIDTRDGRPRVDVHDGGNGLRLPAGDHAGGRGLPLVQMLSSLVGISHDGHTHAWAEIAPP